MLGGGSFTTQNKALPGTYMNFVSAFRADAALSERGIAAVPLIMDWGPEQTVFEVTKSQFQTNSLELFGYSYQADEMRNLRELFANATKGVFYRLNTGTKASNDFAEAKYSGGRGNALKIVVAVNAESAGSYDVTTLLDEKKVDQQTVTTAADLRDNAFVVFKKKKPLEATAGTPLAGGTSDSSVGQDGHQACLTALEPYSFHVLCCPATDEAAKSLYVAYTRRLRDEAGINFRRLFIENQTRITKESFQSKIRQRSLSRGWYTGRQEQRRPVRSIRPMKTGCITENIPWIRLIHRASCPME